MGADRTVRNLQSARCVSESVYRLRRAPRLENRALELTAVAITAFLLGSAVRVEWAGIWRSVGLLLSG